MSALLKRNFSKIKICRKLNWIKIIEKLKNENFEKIKIQKSDSTELNLNLEKRIETNNWGMHAPLFKSKSKTKPKTFLIAGFEQVGNEIELEGKIELRSPYSRLEQAEEWTSQIGTVLNKGIYPNHIITGYSDSESIGIRDLFINYKNVDWLRNEYSRIYRIYTCIYIIFNKRRLYDDLMMQQATHILIDVPRLNHNLQLQLLWLLNQNEIPVDRKTLLSAKFKKSKIEIWDRQRLLVELISLDFKILDSDWSNCD